MGAALYIELKEVPAGLNTLMNGKALSKSWEELDCVAATLGIPSITKICIPNWRLPDKWISVFESYRDYVNANPTCVQNPDGVIDDLQSVLRLLTEAKRVKTKWRLMVDY